MNVTNITTDAFKEWLKTKEPLEVVGVTDRSRECPLRNYLRREVDSEIVEVYGAFANRRAKNAWQLEEVLLPDWCDDFVSHLDGSTFKYAADVTAALALEVLEGVGASIDG